MKYTIAFQLIIIVFCSPIFAQSVGDTIYFNSNWKKIDKRANASYFRTIDKKTNDVFYVTDHYINGNPQMRGAYSFADPDIKNGEFTFYNSLGQVTKIENYRGNKLNGRSREFHADGTLSSDQNYIDDKREGKYTGFEPNGKVLVIINYVNDKKDGKYQYFYPNGKVADEIYYLNGEYNGKNRSYFETGQLRADRDYANGKLNGAFLSYYPDGAKKRVDHFKNDNLTDGKCFTHSGVDTTYFPYLVAPEFKGGEAAIGKYLRTNLKYPDAAKENNITGKIYISFYIDATGNLVDARVAKRVDPLLDEAALAVVKAMPQWKPGKVDGQPDRIAYTLPINFSLSDR